MIVTDPNTIAYLYLPSDFSKDAEALLLKDEEWMAPLLWRSEHRNILATYVRNGMISIDDAIEIQQQAETLLSGNEYEVNSLEVLQIANGSGCSAYDSEFVCLAKNTGSRLITADKRILKSFPDIASTAQNFISGKF